MDDKRLLPGNRACHRDRKIADYARRLGGKLEQGRKYETTTLRAELVNLPANYYFHGISIKNTYLAETFRHCRSRFPVGYARIYAQIIINESKIFLGKKRLNADAEF